MAVVTRFAPSPTGPLHLGHAFAAMVAHDLARAEGGTFLLRIEDIDRARSRPEWQAQIYDDLRWLGLEWDGAVMVQSARQPAYDAALAALWARGLIYPCTCTRRDIEAALSAPQEGATPAAEMGPDGPVYPGTGRAVPKGPCPSGTALRLNIARIAAQTQFTETGQGAVVTPAQDYIRRIGDVVLARRDMGTSYHLSVVLDDAAQGITHVTRGADLFEATRIHALLQRALDLPTPIYHHHRLIRDDQGKRLAKRDNARALALYRAQGASPADIRRLVGL
jgi:glutamyl-Q tRNA(Asp) synthetase